MFLWRTDSSSLFISHTGIIEFIEMKCSRPKAAKTSSVNKIKQESFVQENNSFQKNSNVNFAQIK